MERLEWRLVCVSTMNVRLEWKMSGSALGSFASLAMTI